MKSLVYQFNIIVILFLITITTYGLSKDIKNYNKKIAIVHYRVGKTDGVSLEIEKRKQILESMGHVVKLICGPIQNGANFIIDEFEFENPEIKRIKENSFKNFSKNDLKPNQLLKKINSISQTIETKFLDYYKKEKFDIILIHNIFSLGLHLPAALAFYNISKKLEIPIIATHHDFYWERKTFKTPTNNFIKNFLEKYIPPKNNNIIHICINSLAQKDLKSKRNIDSIIFPDVFDFGQNPWIKDNYNSDLLEKIGAKQNDLIVLQATRIVQRKGIEIAIQFVKELEKQKEKLIGKRLYNGKIITKDSSVILLLTGYPEKFDLSYFEKLKKEAKKYKINAKFIHEIINSKRSYKNWQKKYSLWDAYVFADIVTYTSLWEGWGNQFIEAVFAKKPIVVFEYPVFKKDIKKEGYFIISLGEKLEYNNKIGLVKIRKKIVKNAVNQAIENLTSNKTQKFLEKNFNIGKMYHGFDSLKNFLRKLLNGNANHLF
ncbi:glycosyltransferase family 4 protein [Candidatus Babeliales bacterium]|nr:glycosyltransferase family 4 protein [Candidatus Babeliales bacterium]